MSLSRAALIVLILTISTGGLAAGEVTGRTSVIDGDTIEIHGQRIRLHGIDAPEASQLCETETGEKWRCGQKAALGLQDLLGARPASCEPRGTDRYGRLIAVCVSNGIEVNGWLVAQGLALAYRKYSRDYVGQEEEARRDGRGIWAGRFVAPWDWRRGARLIATDQNASRTQGKIECIIKGNINRDGKRIYHIPEDRDYGRTRIDPSKGERWFCSEEEAQAAGWRPVLN